MSTLRDDAMSIIHESIKAVLPDAAVARALNNKEITTDVVLVAIGKASWNMAKAAKETLGSKVKRGIVDGTTADRIRGKSIIPEACLANNDSYHALKASGDLIVTGPTGTNVNDLMVVLCK